MNSPSTIFHRHWSPSSPDENDNAHLNESQPSQQHPTNSSFSLKIASLPSALTKKIINLLSDHLEFTKLQILSDISVSLSSQESIFLQKFFVDTDVELDAELEYLMRYWREEFMLRLKSKQQLLVDDYIPNKKPMFESQSEREARVTIAELKHEISEMKRVSAQKEQEMLVLEAMVERREKMIEENRQLFYRELLMLKEEHFKQLLVGNFEFLEHEKLVEDIPRDLQTASMYYNAGAVIKGLKKIRALEQQLEAQQKEVEKAKQKQEQLIKKENDLLNRLDEAHKDTQKYIGEYEIVKAKYMEVQSTVEEQNETLEMTTAQLQSFKNRIAELEMEISSKNDEIEAVSDAATQIRNLRRQSDSLSSELDDANAQLVSLYTEKKRRDSELSELPALRAQNEELNEKVGTLNQQILSQSQTIERLMEELRGARGGYDDAWSEQSGADFSARTHDSRNMDHMRGMMNDAELSRMDSEGKDSPLMRKFGFGSRRQSSFEYHSPRGTKPPPSPAQPGETRSSQLTSHKGGLAKTKLQKIRTHNSFGDLNRWSDRDENGVMTPLSIHSRTPITPHDENVNPKNPISSIYFQKRKTSNIEDEDLHNTFGVVADTLEELDELQQETRVESPERPRPGVDVKIQQDVHSREELEAKQKERAEYLLKQYYLYREKNEVLKRLEKRTKLMYERVRLKKSMLEQEKQEQLERCLSVYQLLSKTHPNEATLLERQHLQHLREEYEASRAKAQKKLQASAVTTAAGTGASLHNQTLNALRNFQTPSPSMSDTIRPKSAAPTMPGSQNRFHVMKRRVSLDERSMDEVFRCKTVTPAPVDGQPTRPHTSNAMRRPYSTMESMQIGTPPKPPRPATTSPYAAAYHVVDSSMQQEIENMPTAHDMHLSGGAPPIIPTFSAFRAASAPPDLHEKQDRYRPEKRRKKSARSGSNSGKRPKNGVMGKSSRPKGIFEA